MVMAVELENWDYVAPYYWNAYYSIVDARNTVLDAIFKMSVERERKLAQFSKEVADNVIKALLDKLNATVKTNFDSKLAHLHGEYAPVSLGKRVIPVRFNGDTISKEGRDVVAFPEFTFDLAEFMDAIRRTSGELDRRAFLLRWEIDSLPVEGDFEDVNFEYKVCSAFVQLFEGFLAFRLICVDLLNSFTANFERYGRLPRFTEFGVFESIPDVYRVEGVYGTWYGLAWNFGDEQNPDHKVWGLYSPSGYVLYLDSENKYRTIAYSYSFFISNEWTEETIFDLCFLNWKMRFGKDSSIVYCILQDHHGREKPVPLIAQTPHLDAVYIDNVSLDQSVCVTGESEESPVPDVVYYYFYVQ